MATAKLVRSEMLVNLRSKVVKLCIIRLKYRCLSIFSLFSESYLNSIFSVNERGPKIKLLT